MRFNILILSLQIVTIWHAGLIEPFRDMPPCCPFQPTPSRSRQFSFAPQWPQDGRTLLVLTGRSAIAVILILMTVASRSARRRRAKGRKRFARVIRLTGNLPKTNPCEPQVRSVGPTRFLHCLLPVLRQLRRPELHSSRQKRIDDAIKCRLHTNRSFIILFMTANRFSPKAGAVKCFKYETFLFLLCRIQDS